MRKCHECDRNLRFYQGHRHPILGKNYVVCTQCYQFISKSITFYNTCLLKGRQHHKNDCYFWDKKQKKCRNEQYFITARKQKNITHD